MRLDQVKNTPHPKWTGEDPQDSGVRKELREGEGVKDNWTLGGWQVVGL